MVPPPKSATPPRPGPPRGSNPFGRAEAGAGRGRERGGPVSGRAGRAESARGGLSGPGSGGGGMQARCQAWDPDSRRGSSGRPLGDKGRRWRLLAGRSGDPSRGPQAPSGRGGRVWGAAASPLAGPAPRAPAIVAQQPRRHLRSPTRVLHQDVADGAAARAVPRQSEAKAPPQPGARTSPRACPAPARSCAGLRPFSFFLSFNTSPFFFFSYFFF